MRESIGFAKPSPLRIEQSVGRLKYSPGPKGGLIPWVGSAACLDDLAMHGKVQHGPPTTAGTAAPGCSRQAEHASTPGTESPRVSLLLQTLEGIPAKLQCSALRAGEAPPPAQQQPLLGPLQLSASCYLAIAGSRVHHKMEL